MSLADVKHQGNAQRMLQRAVTGGRVPHAYIFHGPGGVGKETMALSLAQLLLCTQPTEAEFAGDQAESVGIDRLRLGCGKCEDCKLVVAGTHPDLHIVYRQLHREHPVPDVRKRKGLDIGVDVLRHFVIDRVAKSPARAKCKVFLIREADRITPQAQNALLKTLEEPPGTTYLVLLVEALDRLLATTLSRCQVIPFDALPTTFVVERLQASRPNLSSEQAAWYARTADGSIGRAMSFVYDALFELNEPVAWGLMQSAKASDLVAAWTEAAKRLGQSYRKADPEITDTEATRRGLKTVFLLAANLYGDILRVLAGEGELHNSKWAKEIGRAAAKTTAEETAVRIGRIAEAERQLDLNANVQLIVEVLIHELVEGAVSAQRS